MQDRIWVAIHRHGSTTRVLATAGPTQTLLKARLAADPWHQRALPSLLEALALWQKQQVHAVLVADGRGSTCDTGLFTDLAAEHARTPLYTLDWADGRRRSPRRSSERVDGVGDFREAMATRGCRAGPGDDRGAPAGGSLEAVQYRARTDVRQPTTE